MPTANRQPGANFRSSHQGGRQRLLGWIPAFLESMARGVCLREACRISNTTPSAVYQHRASDEAFRACWDRAVERGTDLLEQEAVRRAYHGTEKPVFYKGEQCGTVQEYSDTLLMFMLRGRKPETYRDKEHSGVSVNVQTNVQANQVAASAIREMIANGELTPTGHDGRLLEGGSPVESAPLESTVLGTERHAEVVESTSHPVHGGGTSSRVANGQQ